MSIGPILPGRIPATLVISRLQDNLRRSNELLVRLQDQVATGQKFFSPSESPAAAVRTIVLQRIIERKTQMQVNLAMDRSMLEASEAALGSVSDALNQAKSLLLAGVGNTTSAAEKEALANELATIVGSVINAGNSKFRGRYLFGGSASQQLPFENTAGGVVRYNGDRLSINSFIDFDLLVANNVDGVTAFGAATSPVGADVDPALTLSTKLSDLLAGQGVQAGPIQVTVDTGTPSTVTVDLTNAETIGDVKTLLENAFPPGDLTVEVDPGSNSGLRLTPASGTVAVADITGSTVARDLGIASAASAVINGGDLDPRLTLLTPLAAFNNGSGASVANGLLVTNGSLNKVVDISSATNVEELFNLLEAANLDLELGINSAGNGLHIASRLSGADFAVGENGGSDAAQLGIRTFTGSTLLGDLNLGGGVPVNKLDADGTLLPALVEITRRDGTGISIDLKGLSTVQDVLDAINAFDPGVLVASLNAVGNGITILDNDGVSTGPLTVEANPVGIALGIDGTEPGSDPTVPIVGQEVNARQATGVFNLLLALERALRNGDDEELQRLDPLLDAEIGRLNVVRGDLGGRLKLLDDVENQLLDEEIVLQQTLSNEFDVDITQAVTQAAATSATLQATMALAAQTLQLSLLNFL